ncbi:MmcQ/YjbR family DNA-binding protein [Marinovum sp. SP66]|uniref:MmcQ/YjbR family DNA-binding protein n=1 Tax=Marinovum TaxID=367771 RepID=UPI00237AB402|nr:MmcQ/YjbR family DNA-binding protein [Marinovum sp. SP66]MDD9739058.1 MmcQ/YjbR family DNA-binding protein [Marinovum sp. SP66]
MSREMVNAICAAMPGAEVSDPWGGGHDAWKVGGKMFACVGALGGGVSVKTADVESADVESASALIEIGRAVKAPYFHRSWVQVPFDRLGPKDITNEELRERLVASYRIVRAKLPKKVQAGLDPAE